jgi:dolichyl-phosphate-mannose-protein mannosyltransferase
MRARLRSILELEARVLRPRRGGGVLALRVLALLLLLGAWHQGLARRDRVVEETLAPAQLQALTPAGHVVQVDLPLSWGDTPAQARERLWISEDGVELGPAHASYRDLVGGRGAYRHWRDQLYFSARDGTPPASNGRSYSLRYFESRPSPLFVLFAAGVFLLWADPLRRALLRAELTPPGLLFLGLFVLTVGLRLWWGFEPSEGYSRIGQMPYSDARSWQDMSESIARTGAIPEGHLWGARRPLTYWIHGSWMALVGVSTLAIFWLNVICSGLSTVLIFDGLRRLAPFPIALCAALAHACSLLDAAYGATTLSEPSGYFLSNVSLWLLALAIVAERRSEAPRGLYFLAGVALAASNLARPLTLLVAPALPLVVLCVLAGRGLLRWQVLAGALRAGACLALGVVLVLGPWIARQKVEHDLLTLSDNTAEMLFAASDPRYGTWTTEAGLEATRAGHHSYAARNRYYNGRLKENLAKHPGHYAKVIVHSAGATLVGLLSGPNFFVLGLCLLALWGSGRARAGGEFFVFAGAALAIALALAWGAEPPRVWPFFLLGCLFALRSRDVLALLVVALAVTLFAMGLVATPYVRFSYSLQWLAVALQVWGVWQLGRWARRGGSPELDLEGLRAEGRLIPVTGEQVGKRWIGGVLLVLFATWGVGLGIVFTRRLDPPPPPPRVAPVEQPLDWLASASRDEELLSYPRGIREGLCLRRFRIPRSRVARLGAGEDMFHTEWVFERAGYSRSYFLPDPPALPTPRGLRAGYSHFPGELPSDEDLVVTALGCWSALGPPERAGNASSRFEIVAYTRDESPAGATWVWAPSSARELHRDELIERHEAGDLRFAEIK